MHIITLIVFARDFTWLVLLTYDCLVVIVNVGQVKCALCVGVNASNSWVARGTHLITAIRVHGGPTVTPSDQLIRGIKHTWSEQINCNCSLVLRPAVTADALADISEYTATDIILYAAVYPT